MIEILDHQSRWTRDGDALAGAVFEAAGGRFVRVDHIGSTAVPGLASKDVLDLQVTVDNFDGTDALVEPLRPLGFEFRAAVVTDHVPAGLLPGPGWAKRYFARRIGLRAHLHVRATGQPNQRYALLFRDYLRCSPQAAAAYAAFKRHLAATELDYVDAKDSFCDMVMVAAEAWAERVGWRLPARVGPDQPAG